MSNGGGWAAQTPARAGLAWCDARHIYPPRCQGPCGRTYVQLARDHARLTYSADTGPMCKECKGMARIDWQQEIDGRQLWEIADELHQNGLTWDEVADEMAEYNLEVSGQRLSSAVSYRRQQVEKAQGGGGAPPRRAADAAHSAPPPVAPAAPGRERGKGNGNGDGDGDGDGEVEMMAGISTDLAPCSVEVRLPGYYLRAEGNSREELCERLNMGSIILEGAN